MAQIYGISFDVPNKKAKKINLISIPLNYGRIYQGTCTDCFVLFFIACYLELI